MAIPKISPLLLAPSKGASIPNDQSPEIGDAGKGRVKIWQPIIQEVKKGVITQEQAADKIISLREKIDAIYDEMHGQLNLK